MQQNLIKKKDDMVEKAQTEVEEITQSNTEMKVKNVELENEISTHLKKIKRIREEERNLKRQIIEERTKFDQVVKRNLLIDELNKDMMEMNIEDL